MIGRSRGRLRRKGRNEQSMSNSDLHGVIVPVITPTNENEEVDEAAFRKLLRRLIKAGVHGIFVGGSAGEGPLLGARQWRRMAEIAGDEIGGDVPLLGGAMDTSVQKVCEKVAMLRDLGYRYVVVTPTFYLAARTATEHLRLFGQVKECAGPMEVVAYNIPQCTGTSLALDTVVEMVKRGWTRYCKESSGDWAYLSEMIRRGREIGLTVLAGDESTAGEAVLAGARGVVLGCSSYDPRNCVRLYEAAVRGDRQAMTQAMTRLEVLKKHLCQASACWLAGIKYAVGRLGIGSGKPLSPLEPADAEGMTRIDALVKADLAAKNVEP
jgi:4-hydroxy-tetrahydrodipicolinate synthase